MTPSIHNSTSILAILELSAIERQDCLVIERITGRPQNSTVEGII